MAVFTPVSAAEARMLLARYDLGEFVALRGIESGIENSNFFLTTTRGEYVLTLFERLAAEQLPFYLNFTSHLTMHGLPVPGPKVDRQGHALFMLHGKPGAIVSKLHGAPVLDPDAQHCAQLGATLARMHLAAQSFEGTQPNLRGLAWWQEVVPQLRPMLGDAERTLIDDELRFQTALAATPEYARLPRSAVHADLFRDNAMFDQGRLSGIFDFYFAGVDTWLFDLAVCLNDWCLDRRTHGPATELDTDKVQALLRAYAALRPFTGEERALLPALLRTAAMRFWVSRLADLHMPRDAALLKAHDPGHFERILRARRERPFAGMG
jgi:homoserine kinase type II